MSTYLLANKEGLLVRFRLLLDFCGRKRVHFSYLHLHTTIKGGNRFRKIQLTENVVKFYPKLNIFPISSCRWYYPCLLISLSPKLVIYLYSSSFVYRQTRGCVCLFIFRHNISYWYEQSILNILGSNLVSNTTVASANVNSRVNLNNQSIL